MEGEILGVVLKVSLLAFVFSSMLAMGGPNEGSWRFIHADYRRQRDVAEHSVGLLVSLYAGFVSEFCTRHLRPDAWLLINPGHGDVAMASIDPKHRLAAVINARSGDYSMSTRDLSRYLVPKRPVRVTPDMLHESGRGVAYTRSPLAYLSQRVS